MILLAKYYIRNWADIYRVFIGYLMKLFCFGKYFLMRHVIVDKYRCVLHALIKSNFCKCFGVNKIWQFIKSVIFKVSGTLALIVWKKTLLQLFLYFSAQIETGNYKSIYEPQFRHFIKWDKICVTFSTFYDRLRTTTPRGHKIFQLFLTSAC